MEVNDRRSSSLPDEEPVEEEKCPLCEWDGDTLVKQCGVCIIEAVTEDRPEPAAPVEPTQEEIDAEAYNAPAPDPPVGLNSHPRVIEIYISLDKELGTMHLAHPPNILTCCGLMHMALDMLMMKLKGQLGGGMASGPQIHRPGGRTPPNLRGGPN